MPFAEAADPFRDPLFIGPLDGSVVVEEVPVEVQRPTADDAEAVRKLASRLITGVAPWPNKDAACLRCAPGSTPRRPDRTISTHIPVAETSDRIVGSPPPARTRTGRAIPTRTSVTWWSPPSTRRAVSVRAIGRRCPDGSRISLTDR